MRAVIPREFRTVLISRAEQARGYSLDFIVWLRKPTEHERMALMPALVWKRGIELKAFEQTTLSPDTLDGEVFGMSMDTIPLRDFDGIVRQIRGDEVMRYLMETDFRFCGMSKAVIMRLRAEYEKLGGRMPMTVATVTECFRRMPA